MTGKIEAVASEEEALNLEQLRQMLKMRIPEEAELHVDEFINIEAALTLALAVGGPDVDADKVNVLLSNYALIRPETFGPKEHLMQLARRNLLHFSSAMTWRKSLKCYMQGRLKEIRCFDVNEGHIAVREDPFGGVDRRPLYKELLAKPAGKAKAPTVAQPGHAYRYYCRPEGDESGVAGRGHDRQVTIPDGLPGRKATAVHLARKGRREKITVTLDEMIAVAEEVCPAAGRAYCVEVLKRIRDGNLLKSVAGSGAAPTDELTVEQVCSLVGLVGAGKSVFANLLIVTLARRGYKVVSLLNSVSDVIDCVLFLRAVGVEASPLVSRNNRILRLNEVFDQGDAMLIDEEVSRYLETPCLIDGLSYGEQEACSYSGTPCYALQPGKSASCVCPYWDVCPSQAMVRAAVESNVVITTPSGFAMMTVGKEKTAFFEHALSDFDLVIFDEADRVQVQLDSGFAPEMSFQELIYHSADPTAAAMKRQPASKMRDLDEERFYDLRQNSEPVAKALLQSARSQEVASWPVVKKEAFTSLTLLSDLKDQGLPEAIVGDLEARVSGFGGKERLLDQAIALSCQSAYEELYEPALGSYLESKHVELGEVLKLRFSFLLKVVCFDEYLQKLAAASDFLSFKDESMAELYNFLRFSHVRQQRYLPSSLIGNLFGLRMTEDNDLILFRQFAFGRAFMGSLPWFETDESGGPAGPHVLLLSGSSYEPGCLQYHVNRPVNYLLEAQPWIAEKLAGSVIKDLRIGQNVSGSATKFRARNLGIVLSRLMDTLCAELDSPDAGKVLVIVNSYREAEEAREKLETLFRSRGRADKVCALVKSPKDDKERFVPRSEVYRFAAHTARILVAPAMAIERGYNIVDDLGHAAFSTLVFSVRPMGMPHDIGARYRRLNGLIESEVGDYPKGAAEFAKALRADAWVKWKSLERSELLPLKVQKDMNEHALVDDVIATLMVTIIQIFGRLARVADPSRPAPHVYFADGAFRGSEDEGVASFHTLKELDGYMEELINKSSQPAVAQALYGPFYAAFKKGIE